MNSSLRTSSFTRSVQAGLLSLLLLFGNLMAQAQSNVATAISLTSSVNPALTGNSVTITATVTSNGNPVTLGTVSFSEGQQTLITNVALNGNGQATFTKSDWAEGSHIVTANYSGATGFGSSSGSLNQTVNNPSTVTGTTFCNDLSGITINDNAAARPYPSRIFVSGLSGTIQKVTISLKGLTHTAPDDIDVLLVSPTGQKFILMSDAGGTTAATNLTLVFDSSAGSTLSDNGALSSGTFRPADFEVGSDVFPAPAPSGPYISASTTTLGTLFNNTDPNGTWQLYIVDDGVINTGSLGSWCLNFTMSTSCPTASFTAPTLTQPTCATVTGTIVVNATSTGTLDYSIDNGNTWQTSATFSGLTAGNYNIKVRLQATPTCITTYSSNPVVLTSPFTASTTTDTWTGCVSTDWNTAGNWQDGSVPLATNDVVIPSTPVNQPILSTTATAKSVEVQSGASLSISSAGSLSVNGSKSFGGFTTAFYNKGTVVNGGGLVVGNLAGVGQYGLWNAASFSNVAGGSIQFDRSAQVGLFNQDGSFVNAGGITIGANQPVGDYGLWNRSSFSNVEGGSIHIDRSNTYGLWNQVGSFVNAGGITIGAVSAVGNTGIFNSTTFQNTGCDALINVLANAVISDFGTFSNTGTIIENASGNSSISSNAGLVQNLNGGTFTVTGTNTGVLTTSPGPLPTITATPSLTITQGQSNTLTASGATSYSWSTGETTPAISVSVAGPYSVTGTTGGCSSTATVSMTVKPVPTFTVSNPAICSGQYVNLGNFIGNKSPNNGDLTYYTTQADAQAGTNALTSGLVGPVNAPITYYARYDAEGLFSIQPIMVTLKPASPAPPTLTQTGHAYTGGVASVTVIQNSESVILAVPGCDGTVLWSGPNNFISFSSTISVPTSTTGSFTYLASCTSQTDCYSGSSQATVTVLTMIPAPTITLGTPGAICQGTASLLIPYTATTGNPTAYTVSGTGISGSGSLSGSSGNLMASLTSGFTGSFTVVVQTSQGQSSSVVSGSVTVNAPPTATLTPTSATLTCASPSVTLTAGGGTSYTFANGSGVLGTPGATNTLVVNTPGTYSVTVGNAAGCVSTTSSTVISNTAIISVSNPATSTALANSALTLSFTATGGVSPYFTTVSITSPSGTMSSNSAISDNFGVVSITTTPNEWGLYTVTASATDANGCVATGTAFTINVGPGLTLTASPDPVCVGSPISVNASIFNPTALPFSYTLTAGSSTTTGTSSTWTSSGAMRFLNQALVATGSGAQSVVLTVNQNGRVASQSVTITVNPLPTVSIAANPSLTITQGQSTTLTASVADSYSWTTGETTAAISVSVAGPYSVTGTTTGGCSATASVTLTVNPPACGAGLSGPIWTGCVSTDWNTAGNWASGAIPTATDDVIIPSTPVNQPIISTTATAKSVEVQTGASFSITSAGSLTINSFATLGGFPTAFYNQGTVTNNGALILGNTAPVGLIGLHNTGTFTNTGTLQVDRATNQGINNRVTATFTNTGLIAIGTVVSMGTQGIWNQASFANTGGTITIDRITGDALLNTGSFVNSAAITIGASASVTGSGISSAGSFTNATGGAIRIDQTGTHGISQSNNGTFINSATITVGASATVGGNGIQIAGGTFDNIAGVIQIDHTTGFGFLTNGSGTVHNSGSITTGGSFSTTLSGVLSAGAFTNNIDGTITINRAGGSGGLNNSGTFINDGHISVGEAALDNQDGIQNYASFTNSATGEIRADRANFNGIWNLSGSFSNDGKIFIGSVANTGGTGILNTGTSFSNTAGASILLDRVERGLINTSMFTNAGQIRMGSIAPLRGGGLLNGNGSGTVAAVFDNLAGALIQIDQTADGQDGITNKEMTTFTNASTVSVGTSGTIGGNGITNAGTVSNSACATLTVVAPINNSSNFTNAGLFTVSTTRLHSNTGTLTNNGLISYPQGNPIPNVVNNDVVAAPFSLCGTSSTTALQIGGANSFQIGTAWYSDPALTQQAGTYDNGTNSFTPTSLSAGNGYILYFTAIDNVNNCTKTVSASVTVNAPPVASLTSGTLTCAQTSGTLTASGGSSYTLSDGQTNTNGLFVVSVPGNYTITVSNASGCTATAMATVTSNTTLPVATLMASGTLTCAVTSVTLTATGGNAYAFTGLAVVSQNTTAGTAVVNASGVYSVTVINTVTGCASMTTTTVISNTAAPVASLSASSPSFCAGTSGVPPSVTLTAGGGISYAFTGPGLNQSGATSMAVVSQGGTYSVVVTSVNGCTATASVSLTVNPLPTAPTLTGVSRTVAASSTPLPLGQFVNATGTNPLSFSGISGLLNPPQADISSSGLQSFSVSQTDGNGCVSVATPFSLTVVATPASQTVCRSSRVVLTASTNGVRYEWYKNGTSAPFKLTEIASIQKGTSTASLTIVSIQTTASYYCKVFQANGSFSFDGPYTVTVNYGCIAPGARLATVEVVEVPMTITLTPNPVSEGQLRAIVRGAGGQSLTVELVDLRGQVLHQQNWPSADAEQVVEWNISQQTSGLYLLKAAANGQIQTVKVLHQ